MRSEILYDAITEVKDGLVEEAREDKPAKSRTQWLKFGAIAAAAALVVGIGSLAVRQFGGNYSPGSSAAGGSGHEDGSCVFMSYAGPVFPLTVLEGGGELTAERALTYDFSPWTQVWWSNEDEANSRTGLTEEERQEVLKNYNEWYPEGGRFRSSTDLLVTDAYTLQNPTDEDKTVKVLYPFVSSLRELEERAPTLEADGNELSPVLHAGGYSGGFQAVDGSSDALLNLERLNSWEGYRDLLSDGRYLDAALEDFPDLSDTPVIVYKFTDYYGPEPDEKAGRPNPTIRADFDLDYGKTTVLSYGFHGMSRDRERGHMIQSFSIPEPYNPWYGEPYYLFVVGEDIRNLTTGGYVTGGTDADTKKLDGCGVEAERYEADLESALRTAAELMYGTNSRFETTDGSIDRPDFELYFGLMKEFLVFYGPLSENGPARYDNGWLGHMEFASVDRVFYLEASVIVPAGGSVELSAHMVKPPSYDFYCAHTENRGICGYDMVTQLGTSLNITHQTAKTLNTDGLEIVRQNFGFDWASGVNEAVLDPAVEHYCLEMRRSKTDAGTT